MRLLQAAFRLSACSWLNLQQRIIVEQCIKALADISKNRGIAIPIDLEKQVNNMFGKSALISKNTKAWLTAARTGSGAVVRPRISLDLGGNRRSSTGQQQQIQGSTSPKHSISPTNSTANFKNDRTIIEGLQDIVSLLHEQLRPLVQAELSVLVDILYRPENLFPVNTEARTRCENGGFISKLITHTGRLLEENEDNLCARVLETLKEMVALDPDYEEKVSHRVQSPRTFLLWVCFLGAFLSNLCPCLLPVLLWLPLNNCLFFLSFLLPNSLCC